MLRIAVIGNAAGGKSTLSARLGQALNIEVCRLDHISWTPDCDGRYSDDEITVMHDEIVAKESWIIDGWGHWSLIKTRFEAADTIIFVDFPLYVHCWWAFKREIKSLFLPVPYYMGRCRPHPFMWKIAQIIWGIHKVKRPRLMSMIDEQRSVKRVIDIRSPRQLNRFIKDCC